MFYIVKSDTKSIKDKLIDNLLGSNSIDGEDVYVYDYEEGDSIEEAFTQYLTRDFDGKQKAVIIKNSSFINEKRIDKRMSNRFRSTIFLKSDNIMVFTVDKLNKTGYIRKEFENELKIVEKDSPGPNEISSFIKSFFDGRNIKIDYKNIELIKERSSGDFDLLVKELTKLDILQTNKEITEEHIRKATLDFSRERLYKIAEYVITLNEDKISSMMDQYRSEGESTYLIGEFMVRDFSKLLSYKIMRDKGYSDSEIKEMTNWNPWAIKNYSKWSSYWSEIEDLKNFFYDVILEKCFLGLMRNPSENPINDLEKILIANVIKTKNDK